MCHQCYPHLGEMPHTPLTPLQAMAARHHELYQAWQAAGFTANEAMELLCTVISTPPPGYHQ